MQQHKKAARWVAFLLFFPVIVRFIRINLTGLRSSILRAGY
jgi:hypothetical protein